MSRTIAYECSYSFNDRIFRPAFASSFLISERPHRQPSSPTALLSHGLLLSAHKPLRADEGSVSVVVNKWCDSVNRSSGAEHLNGQALQVGEAEREGSAVHAVAEFVWVVGQVLDDSGAISTLGGDLKGAGHGDGWALRVGNTGVGETLAESCQSMANAVDKWRETNLC